MNIGYNCTNTTFSNVYFKENTAGTNGGAIDWHEGAEDGHLLYAVFEQNTAKRSGGAIYWNGKNGEIKHSNFTGNKALGTASAKDAFGNITYGGDGGAVIWIGSEGEVDNCTFEDNSAFRGGAIFSCFSQIHVENCRFIGNYGYEFAGAIFNDELSSMTIVNSEFWGNVSFDDTHDIMSVESSLKIIGCKFTSLSAKGTSILARSYGNLVLKDSTFNKSNVTAQNMSVVKGCDFIDSTLDTARGVLYCNEKEKDNIPFIGGNIHYLENNMDWVRELTQHEFAAEFRNCHILTDMMIWLNL